MTHCDKPPRWTPTPDEIADACRQIQATWDEYTRELRNVYKSPVLTVPGSERAPLDVLPSRWHRKSGSEDEY